MEILHHKIIAPKRKLRGKEAADDAMSPKKTKPGEKQEIPIAPAEPAEEDELQTPTEVIKKEKSINPTIMENLFELQPETQPGPETLAAFENLYDEAFDVTLPSLLWGIHRDPDRRFIVFSEFHQATMSICKLLRIDDALRCKTFVNNELNSSKTLKVENLLPDRVSDLLEELSKEPPAHS